jgi:hypothetical protein
MRVLHSIAVACGTVVFTTLALSTPPAAQPLAPSAAAKRVIGSWRLVDYQTSDAEMRVMRGPSPLGFLYYDNSGHMALQIAPDRPRQKFTGPVSGLFTGPRPTPAEALDALSGYGAYFGTYRVDEAARTVTHNRLGNLNPGATGDFVRRFEFRNDDLLVLEPLDNADVRSVRLSWTRLK